MSLLEVSIASGQFGPVLVLTGEADLTSVTRLDEALTAELCGQAVQPTIDATDLRFADLASMRTLVTAAMEVRTRDGSVTLLNPQPPVVRMLDLLRVDELFSIEAGQRVRPGRTPARTAADSRHRDRPPSPFG